MRLNYEQLCAAATIAGAAAKGELPAGVRYVLITIQEDGDEHPELGQPLLIAVHSNAPTGQALAALRGTVEGLEAGEARPLPGQGQPQ